MHNFKRFPSNTSGLQSRVKLSRNLTHGHKTEFKQQYHSDIHLGQTKLRVEHTEEHTLESNKDDFNDTTSN